MKYLNLKIITFFTIGGFFAFYGAWLTIWHQAPNGAIGAYGAGIFNSLIGYYLFYQKSKTRA